jgi:hypothetical protein
MNGTRAKTLFFAKRKRLPTGSLPAKLPVFPFEDFIAMRFMTGDKLGR